MPRRTHPVWSTRPVFISSTFRDMHAERDHLMNVVFPELEEKMGRRFVHVEPVDLRWGVDSSEQVQDARELQILRVCLDEVERSRPFMVVLLGDRYGWVPPPRPMAGFASEGGYAGDPAGKSVTALEIDFGLFQNPGQNLRTRIYLRRPLPYDRMPPEVAERYSDASSDAPNRTEASVRLQELKRRLQSAFPDRVTWYDAGWDEQTNAVTGLESFAQQVLRNLELDLMAEIRKQDIRRTQSRHREELALESFIELASLDFTGRELLLERLMDICRSERRDIAAAATAGACVVAETGQGKSAVFARLYRMLQDAGALVLAHSAGITPSSRSAVTMIRAWVRSLERTLGVRSHIDSESTGQELFQTFKDLLSKAAQTYRVVCLLDGLEELEGLEQPEHADSGPRLDWIPLPFPANARLIVTTAPGAAASALQQCLPVKMEELPPHGPSESRELARTIAKRYHKSVDPAVVDVLLSKKAADGRLASAKPLWTRLAIACLLLIDSDDFLRAEAGGAGAPAERLRNLLIETAESLPADLEKLCDFVLERTERIHGKPAVRTFAALIASSRDGWREADLAALFPHASGQPWNPLQFAALRRSFRSHLSSSGPHGEWKFNYPEMRTAAERRALADPAERAQYHRMSAQHLSTLPEDDPLRQSDLMFHLSAIPDAAGAAAMYSELDKRRRIVAVEDYFAGLIGVRGEGALAAARWMVSLLDHIPLGDQRFLVLADRVLNVCLRTAGQDNAEARLWIASQVGERLKQLPESDEAVGSLLYSYILAGEAAAALGDRKTAISSTSSGYELAARLAETHPQDRRMKHDVWECSKNIGDYYFADGDMDASYQWYLRAYEATSELSIEEYSNARHAEDAATTWSRLADILRLRDRPKEALPLYEMAVDVLSELVESNPEATRFAYSLGAVIERQGDAYGESGDVQSARRCYEQQRAIVEANWRRSPNDVNCAIAVVCCRDKLTDLMSSTGQAEEGAALCRTNVEILTRLSATHSHPDIDRFWLITYGALAFAEEAAGRSKEAVEARLSAVRFCQTRRESQPEATSWLRSFVFHSAHLALLLKRVGRREEGAPYLESAVVAAREVQARSPEKLEAFEDVIGSLRALGDLYSESGATEKALACYHEAGNFCMKASDLNPRAHWVGEALAECTEKILELSLRSDRRPPQDPGPRTTGLAGGISEHDAGILRGHPLLSQLFEMLEKPEEEEAEELPESFDYLPDFDDDREKALKANAEFEKELARWQALPWWRRMRTKKPDPPPGYGGSE